MAQRSPFELSRFAGEFALRLPERAFAAPLSKPPPRLTRLAEPGTHPPFRPLGVFTFTGRVCALGRIPGERFERTDNTSAEW